MDGSSHRRPDGTIRTPEPPYLPIATKVVAATDGGSAMERPRILSEPGSTTIERHGARFVAVVIAVVLVGGCGAVTVVPSQAGAETAVPSSRAPVPQVQRASASAPPAAPDARRLGGRIAFVMPDDNWELYSLFSIDPDGSNETRVPNGTTRWSWVAAARDGRFLVSVGDAWARPAVVAQDGSRLTVLDAYPERHMHLSPFDWSADGSRVLVVNGAPAPHPDRPSENTKAFGVYSVAAAGGLDLRRLS